ncbi:histidine--tRNA ligase [Candidatus Jorgensenbacteria bacterium RIFCSPLOWO2_02_FULL_45_12]|uniref:Histidine--tRNA ligase n=1 Tax=Candidatus Jorgensenbacteria bacterium RIFCSPHIGHO2_02_FULL_45_20 TaxID=1798470 RepID=A0A1F6BQK0_9BACT|nr:MAG: histidine--tRNA ligase [Candidatus Jorgensenbacteria bacterium RIFCSPHIGHO2_02_FULL_45_20]OGG42274.1 MAG: histidine--tRNA ligase [Candidatus Jorgensenbacteria bacterium RIFCSPLOWO2_02_FULL_45_12]
MKRKIIKPSLASGFRDYLPDEMAEFQRMTDIIRGVFERYGFSPLDTPGIERLEILTGGDKNFKKQIFTTSKERGDVPLALRFDLTVPLARVAAQYPALKKPFKRYQFGKVWRGEKAQAGRLREFLQCDVDIVGSRSGMADAEIISVAYETLKALGMENFTIKINNRKLFDALPEAVSFPEKKKESVIRALDKLDKTGWKSVRDSLRADKFTKKQIDKIADFVATGAVSSRETFAALRRKFSGSLKMESGIAEMENLAKNISVLGVPESAWKIDLSVARGLGYYTGSVFETIINDIPGIGSVCGGGRYDNLVERFGQASLPAVGISVGIARLFTAMTELGMIKKRPALTEAIILNFDAACEEYVQSIASDLRKGDVRTEIYLGNEETLKGQLAYALNREIPVVLVAGSDEKARNTVQIKNIAARIQTETSIKDAARKVKEVLGKKVLMI